MENTEEEIILVSRDNKHFPISLKAASLSKYVCAFDEMFESEPSVHCSRVSSNCLAKVVEFLNHHEREPMKKINTPLIDHTFEGVVKQQWYRDYVEVDDLLLSEMLAAADFMDIAPLLDLTALARSFRLLNKGDDEIRSALNAPQLSEQAELDAKRNYPWIFED